MERDRPHAAPAASIEMELDPSQSFNKISIFEYQDTKKLADGFSQIRVPRIQQYIVDTMLNGQWQTIYLGDEPMGDCKVIHLPNSYKTSKLRFKVIKALALLSINEICVIDMPEKNNSY